MRFFRWQWAARFHNAGTSLTAADRRRGTRHPAWVEVLRQPSARETAPQAIAGVAVERCASTVVAEATRAGVEIEFMLAASLRQTAKAPPERAQTRAERAQARPACVKARAEREKKVTHTLDSTSLKIGLPVANANAAP